MPYLSATTLNKIKANNLHLIARCSAQYNNKRSSELKIKMSGNKLVALFIEKRNLRKEFRLAQTLFIKRDRWMTIFEYYALLFLQSNDGFGPVQPSGEYYDSVDDCLVGLLFYQSPKANNSSNNANSQ